MKILSIAAVAPLLLLVVACGPNAQIQTGAQVPARELTDATATAAAAPTVAAAQTAEALATQTAALATQVSATAAALATAQAAQNAQATSTAQGASTATAVAQATQQAKDLDERVHAAVAATQQAMPTATPVPPPAPAPAPPVVVAVPQQPAAPVYVPVPVPVPVSGQSAPDFLVQAINESNNATVSAKWDMNPNELIGHMVGRELARSDTNVRTLSSNRTRPSATLVAGYITSWTFDSPTKATVTSNETWHFINYDADTYAVKTDLGKRLYRNVYSLDYVSGVGWKVSYDDVLNPSGDPV
jgi:hypothetical protein